MSTFYQYTQDNFTIELILEDKVFWEEKREQRSFEEILGVFIRRSQSLFFKDLTQSFHLTCYLGRSSKIKKLNNEYRGINRDTDVLSFPLYDSSKDWPEFSEVELGDIYISLDKAWDQGEEFEIGFYSELIHLLAHGFLHLLGFDHEKSEKDAREMEELEERLIKTVA